MVNISLVILFILVSPSNIYCQNIIPNILLNELNAVTAGSNPASPIKQFVELISIDQVNVPLDNINAVFFDDNGLTYKNYSFRGQSTDKNGLLEVNTLSKLWTTTPLIVDSCAAVALYYLYDNVVPDKIELNNTNHVLLDAVVYMPEGYNGPVNPALLQLMVGQPLVESTDYNNANCPPNVLCDPDLSRCRGTVARYGPSFINSIPTAEQANLCPSISFVLNEFHVALNEQSNKEFIEILATDNVQLTNVYLAVFQDNFDNLVYNASLNSTLTSNQLLTIGHVSACPTENPNCMNIVVPEDKQFLPSASSAIAFFYGSPDYSSLFSIRDHLIDSVVYTLSEENDLVGELSSALAPGQGPLLLSPTGDPYNNKSVSRTTCCQVFNQSLFALTVMTPGTANNLIGSQLLSTVPLTEAQQFARINEVVFVQNGTNNIRLSFVELIAHGSVDLSGLVVVIYSAISEEVETMCSCMNVASNNDGFAVCPCYNSTIIDVQGAVVLHHGTEFEFQNANASYGASIGFVDALLYQLYGSNSSYSLQNYFAPGQKYLLPTPTSSQTQVNISRCYGINDNRASWQASFTITNNSTELMSNYCPLPLLYLNELHFNPSYIELKTTEELPLDQASVVFIKDVDNRLFVNTSIVLANFTAEDNALFTIGNSNASDLGITLPIDIGYATAIAILWGTEVPNILNNSVMLDSIVYTETPGMSLPDGLKPYGSTMYLIDTTGQCSLSHCQGSSEFQGDIPSPNMTNPCSNECQYIKKALRLSEVHLNPSWIGKNVNFMFVEVYTPMGQMKLDGFTVVFYSASSLTSFAYCDCSKQSTDIYGYGLCSCPLSGIFANKTELIGAIVLHMEDSTNFVHPITAAYGSELNVVDAILYQAYGKLTSNPLRNYFAPGQNFQYTPPTNKYQVYSIIRCYGDSMTTESWQASFTTTSVATKGSANNCSSPIVFINEIHFNENFIELYASPIELPLDQVTIVFGIDNNQSKATAYNTISLKSQKALASNYFTVGNITNSNLNVAISLPPQSSVAVIVYWNVKVINYSLLPYTGFLSSLVYNTNNNNTVPSSLTVFGTASYYADMTGQCSWSICNPNDLKKFSSTYVAINKPIQCSIICITGTGYSKLTTTVPATTAVSTFHTNMYINELYYDYDTGSSYIELMCSRSSPDIFYKLSFYNVENSKTTLMSELETNISLNVGQFWVATNNMTFPSSDFYDTSILLVPNGPGVVQLSAIDNGNVLPLDTVIYTTSYANKNDLPVLETFFGISNGFVLVNQSFVPYTSMSRCLPMLNYEPSFPVSMETVGTANLCPTISVQLTLNFYSSKLDCQSASFIPIMKSGWQSVLDNVIPECNCGLTESSLNWNGQTTNDIYLCISQGVQSIETIYGVTDDQLNRFLLAYNEYLNSWPILTVNNISITFTNGTEINYNPVNQPNVGLIVGLTVGGIVLVIVIVGLLYYIYRRRKQHSDSNRTSLIENTIVGQENVIQHNSQVTRASREPQPKSINFIESSIEQTISNNSNVKQKNNLLNITSINDLTL